MSEWPTDFDREIARQAPDSLMAASIGLYDARRAFLAELARTGPGRVVVWAAQRPGVVLASSVALLAFMIAMILREAGLRGVI